MTFYSKYSTNAFRSFIVLLGCGLLGVAHAGDRLSAGQTLYSGQSLQSQSGQYRLIMQSDGNLVVYNGSNKVIWNTRTANTGGNRLTMQSDGNLVIYTASNSPKWHTHTYNHRNSGVDAVLQDDGNLVLYTDDNQAVWSSLGNSVVVDGSRQIDRQIFFKEIRSQFGRLNQSQVDGIDFLLSKMEADTLPAIGNRTVWLRQIAYMFATIRHEVANRYQPITEFSNTTCRRYDGGCLYKGRGFVQLTHRYNYRKMSPIVGINLVSSPQRALEQNISYTVTSYGMFNGSFTSRRLGTYIRQGTTDYRNARRVVNGLDKANLISGYARTFQRILESAIV